MAASKKETRRGSDAASQRNKALSMSHRAPLHLAPVGMAAHRALYAAVASMAQHLCVARKYHQRKASRAMGA